MRHLARPSSLDIECAPKKNAHAQYRYFQFYASQHAVLTAGSGWAPPVDLYETPTEFVLEANLGGISHQQVQVTFEGNQCRIAGQREERGEPGVRCYHVMEIERGNFSRTLELPVPVDADTARADYQDGYLVLRVKKKAGGEIHGCFSADSMEGFE